MTVSGPHRVETKPTKTKAGRVEFLVIVKLGARVDHHRFADEREANGFAANPDSPRLG